MREVDHVVVEAGRVVVMRAEKHVLQLTLHTLLGAKYTLRFEVN